MQKQNSKVLWLIACLLIGLMIAGCGAAPAEPPQQIVIGENTDLGGPLKTQLQRSMPWMACSTMLSPQVQR